MFKFLCTILLSSACFALPSPSDVDAAYNNGDYETAEKMLKEVLPVHNTAKAHYRMAEVYLRLSRHEEALNELLTSQKLDPSLSFVKSPALFLSTIKTEERIIKNVNDAIMSTNDSPYKVVYTIPTTVKTVLILLAIMSSGFLIFVLILLAIAFEDRRYYFQQKGPTNARHSEN
jgi:tetratricopeptide (TPR) repeat protein